MAVHTEYEGKNVDQALAAASKKLNIPIDEISYDVLHYGNSGLFGLFGVKKAKIRVHLKSDDSSSKEEKVTSLVDEAFSDFGGEKKTKKGFTQKPKKEKKPAPKKPQKKAEPKPPKQEKPAKMEEKVLEDVENKEAELTVSDEAVEKGREALEKILPLLTDGFEIQPEVNGNEVLYNLKADNPGVIIGKKGQNLESVQFLVDKIVNKKSEGRVRVLIDIEDYLERRRQNLNAMALRYAEKVKKTGKPATIGQLSAYERRFIHIALREDRRVRTQSMGEGYYRKLVVFPSRRNKGKRKAVRRK